MQSPFAKLEEYFYGSVTLGERGQLVIPAEARKECNINPGDKLLVFRSPHQPNILMIAKLGEMQQLLKEVAAALEQASVKLGDVTARDENE